jgi:tetratricopeptide (TPR) repeat protein
VLLLVNYRPEYQHGWGSRIAYSQIRLDPLATDGMEELLGALLGTDPSLAALKQRLIARTEGNPFFLEECVRALAESGVVVGETSAYRLGKVAGDFVLPMTVQAVIVARIDRLSREEKLVLQSAAVIGKDLRVAVLRSIADVAGASFEAILASLRHAEFIQETRADPDPEYTFTHALTQEVAYESLLQDRRRDLHARIMQAIECEYPDRLPEQVDRLAHHASVVRCGPRLLRTFVRREPGQLPARHIARQSPVSSRLWSRSRISPRAAKTMAQAIDVLLEMQGPLAGLGQKRKLQDYLHRAKDLAVALEDRSRLARVLALECIYLRAALELDRAIEVGERALTIATDLGEMDLQTIARYGLGVTFHDLGDFVRARHLLFRVVDALDPKVASVSEGCARPDPQGRSVTVQGLEAQIQRMGLGLGPTTILVRPRAWLTLTHAYLGQFVEGISLGEEAIRIAESGGHEFDCIIATNALGSLYVIKGDLGRAVPQLERSLMLARTWSSVGWSTVGFLGQAYAQSERYDEAFRLFQEVYGTSQQVMDEERSSRFRQLGEDLSLGRESCRGFRARSAGARPRPRSETTKL